MRQVRRIPKEKRKAHNLVVYMNEQERDALDRSVDRLGVDNQTIFRSLIIALDEGRIPAATLFDR